MADRSARGKANASLREIVPSERGVANATIGVVQWYEWHIATDSGWVLAKIQAF